MRSPGATLAAGLGMLLASAVTAAPNAPVRVKFEDLPRLIRERNDHVRAGALDREAALSREGHLTRSFLPKVELHAGAEAFRVRDQSYPAQGYGGAEAKVNLFRSFRDSLEERKREAESSVAGAYEKEVSSEELRKARVAYWEVLFQREMVALLKQALEANEQNLGAANLRARNGLSTGTDSLEFRMNRLQLEQDLSRFSLAQTSANQNLAVLLGFPPGAELVLDGAIPHDHEEATREVKQASLDPSQHWSILSIQGHEKAADAERSLARRWWAPSLDFYAGYNLFTYRQEDRPTARERTEAVAGLRLSLPLFDGFDGASESSSKNLTRQALELRARQSARELEAGFEKSRAELKILHELLFSAEKGVPLGDDYLKKTLSEYKRGVKNSPDVLSATQKALELKRRVLELKRDYQISRAELLGLQGK